ncbi:MAG: hypothetical protein MJZ77_06110 [Bacteroidales bacterium]|nr:hypothetical protein [Bacteroidales bacterium]
MKKLLFFILILTISRPLFAQSPFDIYSQTDKLNSCYSKSELICSENSRYTVAYITTDETPIKHKFIVQDMNSNTKKGFCLTTMPNHGYNIHDIELKNGVCYFCGTSSHYHNNMIDWGNPPIDKGFIGYFNINNVLSGNGKYYIVEIEETEELSHLAIGENELVYAVGYPEYCPLDANNRRASSCIVSMDKDYFHNNRWYYDVLYAAFDEEMLMDITSSPDGIYTVSRFQGDNYTFGIRQFKHGPLRNNYNRQQINQLYKFNTYDMDNLHRTWRENYCPIYINGQTIGHVSSDNSHTTNGLTIYKLYLSAGLTPTLASAQFIPESQNIDILDLKDYSYVNNQINYNYTSILIRDHTLNRSTIERANWAETDSYIQNDLYCSLNELVINDITTYMSDEQLLSIGHETEGNQTIENAQHTGHTNRSCFYRNFKRYYPLSVVSSYSGDTLNIANLEKPITADSSNFTSSSVGISNICSH